MKDIIDAILALIPITAYYVEVPEKPTYPYALVWSTSGLPTAEQSLVGGDDLSDLVGVTTVHTTPRNAVKVAGEVVRPALAGAHPVVAGRLVTLSLFDSRQVEVDEKVTLTDTNRHPAFAVDIYRLVSVPA